MVLTVNNQDHWNLLSWAVSAYYNITPSVQVHYSKENDTLYRRFRRANRRRWKYDTKKFGATMQRINAGVKLGALCAMSSAHVCYHPGARDVHNHLFREVKKYLKPTGMLPTPGGLFEHRDIVTLRGKYPTLSFNEIEWEGVDYMTWRRIAADDNAHLCFGTFNQRYYSSTPIQYRNFTVRAPTKNDGVRALRFVHTYDEVILDNGRVLGFCPTHVLRVGDGHMTYRLAFYPKE
jgi:hypothetical protein